MILVLDIISGKPGIAHSPDKLYNDKETISNHMGNKKNDAPFDIKPLIESYIEENSGEYKKKAAWKNFPKKVSFKEFNKVIDDLRSAGKVAIDKEGKIGWIWNPEMVKQYKDRKDLAFR